MRKRQNENGIRDSSIKEPVKNKCYLLQLWSIKTSLTSFVTLQFITQNYTIL